MCTATKPLSRPAAVLTSASSAATVLTSIGNGTAKPRCSISSSTPRTAVTVCSRGIAYSISVKRTRRGLANMSADRSTLSERPARRVTLRFSRGIACGRTRPARQNSPNAWLLSTMSLTYAAARPRGRGGLSVRLFVRVSAVVVCGNTKNSKCSLSRARSSKLSSTSASGTGASTPCSVKAGTQRSVTSAITPSAPRPTRAARHSSASRWGEHCSVDPSASTSVSSTTCAEMLGRRAPVPCVAVEIAPAIVCTSMSPRFSSASPCPSSARLSSWIVMPACTRASPAARSTSSTASRAHRARGRPGGGSRRAIVIGAGSFGTALAVLLVRGGLRVTLQARTAEQAARLVQEQENRDYLPDVKLPPQLRIEPMSSGVERAEYVFLAVPSGELGELARALRAGGLADRAAVVSVAKGLVPPRGLPPTLVLGEGFGFQRVACLGGPAHAYEMAREGAALVAASREEALAAALAQVFTRAGVVCERSDDPLGVELAGAAKNAAALAAGATEAQGLNAAGAAAGHIFAEVWRYAQQLGARPESMIGLAGAGDLVSP